MIGIEPLEDGAVVVQPAPTEPLEDGAVVQPAPTKRLGREADARRRGAVAALPSPIAFGETFRPMLLHFYVGSNEVHPT